MKYFAISILFLIGCGKLPKNTSTKDVEAVAEKSYTQYDAIIQQDLENKQRERVMKSLGEQSRYFIAS